MKLYKICIPKVYKNISAFEQLYVDIILYNTLCMYIEHLLCV